MAAWRLAIVVETVWHHRLETLFCTWLQSRTLRFTFEFLEDREILTSQQEDQVAIMSNKRPSVEGNVPGPLRTMWRSVKFVMLFLPFDVGAFLSTDESKADRKLRVLSAKLGWKKVRSGQDQMTRTMTGPWRECIAMRRSNSNHGAFACHVLYKRLRVC